MIKQPSPESGCGIACIANIMNCNYDEAYERMSTEKCKNKHDDRVTKQQIEKFLELSKISFKSEEILNQRSAAAIIYFRWPNDKRYKHWVIFFNNLFWDPSPDAGNPTSTYPSEPEYCINLHSNLAIENLKNSLCK